MLLSLYTCLFQINRSDLECGLVNCGILIFHSIIESFIQSLIISKFRCFMSLHNIVSLGRTGIISFIIFLFFFWFRLCIDNELIRIVRIFGIWGLKVTSVI